MLSVCLISFLVAMQILSHDYVMRDDLAKLFFAFDFCEKDQDNTVNFSERTSFRAVKTLSALCTIP